MTTFTAPPAATNFRASIKEIAPPWLQGEQGYRFLYTCGIQLDAISEYLRFGVLQRFPGYCRPEALRHIGADRKILRGFRETDAAYAPRLRSAFPTWKFAGNARTLLGQIAAYFSPNSPKLRYVVNGRDRDGSTFADWWTLSGGAYSYHRQSPTNWDWDSSVAGVNTRGRFWVIVYNAEGFTPWYWGDGHYWGGGQSWGYEESFTENFAADARRFVFQWKAAGSHAWRSGGLIVTSDQTLWDPSGSGATYPNGTWNDPSNRLVGPFYLDGI